ncbi:hypothetical protein ACQRD4_06700 [Streptococcus hyointestinalis]|uniref:Phage related protein n=1 Tax=Streptococcus hyointestinalis TaxID=1337 RepID=A0A380KG36_9STRE|nr:hypothetical protein [Streptococcus hyointestinalis]SUN63544.1 phage related protein [Streptococcus hyointestinalis]
MAENGKSPKKPIYKRIWFWILVIALLAFVGDKLRGISSNTQEETKVTATSSSSSSSTEESSTSSSTSSSSSTAESTTAESSTTVVSSFNPVDTSDATIESIATYDDYLTMYQLIVNEYLSNYEAAMAQYGLTDATTFQSMRDGVEEGIAQQKQAYGAMRKSPIVGKSDLVQFLKDYRDELNAYVAQMSSALQ